jgi:thymidylate synthase (FAD)
VNHTSKIVVSVSQQMGGDRAICDAARVSTLGDAAGDAAKTSAQDQGLIKYLMKNRHGSPFEHGAITFVLTAPWFVFWDHVRHRIGFSYNIESSRYRELMPVFYEAETARVQTGKPGAYVMSEGDSDQHIVMVTETLRSNIAAWDAYQRMLTSGISREQAMQVLPMNLMVSGYVTVNPRSVMNFISLRREFSRAEMQTVAARYMEELARYWPSVAQSFEENGFVAP